VLDGDPESINDQKNKRLVGGKPGPRGVAIPKELLETNAS
jgi:hypothetical protein